MPAITISAMSRGQARVASSTWAEYLKKHLNRLEWTNAYLADMAGLDRSLVGRWINGTAQPTVESVRRVCAAFRRDIREGLVASGLLTQAELRRTGPSGEPELNLFNDDELLAELRRRLTRGVRAGSVEHTVTAVAASSGVDSSSWSEQVEPDSSVTEENGSNGTNGFNGRPQPASR